MDGKDEGCDICNGRSELIKGLWNETVSIEGNKLILDTHEQHREVEIKYCPACKHELSKGCAS